MNRVRGAPTGRRSRVIVSYGITTSWRTAPGRLHRPLGALVAKLTDIGVPDGTVESIGKALEPSTTALALLVSHIDDDTLATELSRFAGATLVPSRGRSRSASSPRSWGREHAGAHAPNRDNGSAAAGYAGPARSRVAAVAGGFDGRVGHVGEREANATLGPVESGSETQGTGAAGPPTPLREGQLFAGRYRVEALLGRGNMGTVWRVTDQLLGETVALKTLSIPPAGEELAFERFRSEVRLARRITSPYVARTHDLGSHGGAHYLTMELVEGQSLGRLIEDARILPPGRAARIAMQVAEGVAAAHAAGVVHRDLKPDNVMIEERSLRVVVMDFGIARGLDAGVARTGGIVGTPLYMAPEQLAGQPIDGRADLYALGLILFEMVTGRPAFSGDSPIAVAVERLQKPPPDPRSLAPVPDALAAVIMRCLARDPARRWPDAGSVSRELASFLRAQGSLDATIAVAPASTTQPSTATRPPIAPLLEHDQALAVVPFGYVGSPEQDWIAPGISDELIDVLSRTRGLRVLGRGAVKRFEGSLDPRELGRALEVDFVIDGTVQVGGTRLRVTARLLEVSTGVQPWSERFDCGLEDLFTTQERVAQRIAEALRVSLHGVSSTGSASPAAIELYLRARQRQRSNTLVSPHETVELLERVIELAPDFAPAYASHATACVRAWFLPGATTTRNWALEAEQSVRRAMERAPDLAETHYARAQMAVQSGRYHEAAVALRTAISIAPTMPEGHALLGMLQLESGSAKEGLERLELALELEPTLSLAQFEKARWNGLYGDIAVFDALMEAWAEDPTKDTSRMQLTVRVGAYRHDEARIRKGMSALDDSATLTAPFVVSYAQVMLGVRGAIDEIGGPLAQLSSSVSLRYRALLHQMNAEALGRIGEVERSLHHIRAAVDASLLDIEWMDRCPLLEPARSHPEFAGLRRIVRSRGEAVWSA
jgi:eukaryotic-like serine/threonine-protein kinase